jgi:hypothetical protein
MKYCDGGKNYYLEDIRCAIADSPSFCSKTEPEEIREQLTELRKEEKRANRRKFLSFATCRAG